MTMIHRQRYLNLARAALDGSVVIHATGLPAGVESEIDSAASHSGEGRESYAPALSNETNERYDKRSAAEEERRRLVMGRWRARLSQALRHWDDDTLVALANWHLAVAFGRAGANGFRRHLPPSLQVLSDEDLDALVDWPSLATLEQISWRGNVTSAEQLAVGAQRLAAWWTGRRDAARAPHDSMRSHPIAKGHPEERLPGI